MKGDLLIHLIWVVGTWMNQKGVDGLSRRDLSNGVLAGRSMQFYVPLQYGLVQSLAGAASVALRIPMLGIGSSNYRRLAQP
jgi:hypothetical protein